MRYTVQFDVPADYPQEEKFLDYQKRQSLSRIGEMIGENNSFKEVSNRRYKLAVEAFSSEDWSSFKQLLKKYMETCNELGLSTFHIIAIGKMLKELESKSSKIINNDHSHD